MPSLCSVCHRATVPNYFLIQCTACARFWHHRCHAPPIPDPELIAIIRAFNDARARSSVAVLQWRCGACRKAKLDPAPKPRPLNTRDDPIVVDDDDVIPPPLKRQESPPIVASHHTSAPVRVIDDPIDFLISPPPHSTLAENQQPDLELHSQRASTPSHPSENRQSSRSRSPTRGSPDKPSPSLGQASRPHSGSNEPSFLERWSMASIQLPRLDRTPSSRDPPPPFHPALLPHYINSQYRNSTSDIESDKIKDAWYLAAYGKPRVKDAVPTHDPAGAGSHLHRNRKCRAVRYEANQHPPNANTQSISKVPFYFSVNTWMKQNEDALTLFEAIA